MGATSARKIQTHGNFSKIFWYEKSESELDLIGLHQNGIDTEIIPLKDATCQRHLEFENPYDFVFELDRQSLAKFSFTVKNNIQRTKIGRALSDQKNIRLRQSKGINHLRETVISYEIDTTENTKLESSTSFFLYLHNADPGIKSKPKLF